MPKRQRSISSSDSSFLHESIKIKLEKDCEEEDALVVQSFQPTANFDERNKIKNEVGIDCEMEAIENDELENENKRNENNDEDAENERRFIDKDFSHNAENRADSINFNQSRVKLEPVEALNSENLQNQQEENSEFVRNFDQVKDLSLVSTKFNPDDVVKEEVLIIKEEFDENNLTSMKIQVKISKVDMKISESCAKSVNANSSKSEASKSSEKCSSGDDKNKSISRQSKGSTKSSQNLPAHRSKLTKMVSKSKIDSEENEKLYIKKRNSSKDLPSNSSDNEDYNEQNNSGSNYESDKNEEKSTKENPGHFDNEDGIVRVSAVQTISDGRIGDSTDGSLKNISGKNSQSVNKNTNTKPSVSLKTKSCSTKDKQKPTKTIQYARKCTSKSINSGKGTKNLSGTTKKSDPIPSTSKSNPRDKKADEKSTSVDEKSDKEDQKFFKIFEKRRSSRQRKQTTLGSNCSTFDDLNEQNSTELYSRLSIEDVKDPRLTDLFINPAIKDVNFYQNIVKNSTPSDKNEESSTPNQTSNSKFKPTTDSKSLLTETKSISKIIPNLSKKKFQCLLCPKSFDKKISLQNHQVFHTSSDFICIKCKLAFKTQRNLDNHECPICKFCGRIFKNKPKMIRHVTYVHSKESKLKLFECDLCGKRLKYKISMERHMVEHLEVTKNMRFKCEICNKSFKKRMALQNHQILHITATLSCQKCGMTFKKQKPFEQHKCLICTHCPKQFSSKTKLNCHIRNMHTDVSKLSLYICDICGKGFKYRQSIHRHVLDHRQEAAYNCDICHKKWKSDIALRDHYRLCHATEMVTCQICFKQMKPQCIYQHLRYVHTFTRDFHCKICSATFKTKEKLKRHSDTHNRKFKCEQCSRMFSSQYELTEHLRWHVDPNVFQCQICKKSFSTKSSLNTHSKLHKGIERNLLCPHCPFRTHRQESIKYHLTTHERRDEKLKMKKNWLKCEKCGALLKNKATLWGHNRKVHPTERYECDYCGIFVKTKQSIKIHIEAKHIG